MYHSIVNITYLKFIFAELISVIVDVSNYIIT